MSCYELVLAGAAALGALALAAVGAASRRVPN
jgi:hypothetical protein